MAGFQGADVDGLDQTAQKMMQAAEACTAIAAALTALSAALKAMSWTGFAAAMAAWRPDSSVAGIIRGLEALGRGRGDEAVRHLRDEALAAEPHSGEAQALLGFALEQAGYRQAADAVLEPLIERGGDGADLARAVLAARRGPPEIRR